MNKIVYAVIGVLLLGACCIFGLLMVRRAGTDSPSGQLRHGEQVPVPQAGTGSPSDQLRHGEQVPVPLEKSAIPETGHGPSQDTTSTTELRKEARLNAANEARKSQGVPSLTPSERSQFLKASQALLERHRLSWEGREPVVVLNGDEVTVTFPPPKGARAGDFIIIMERETKKILDVKIWR